MHIEYQNISQLHVLHKSSSHLYIKPDARLCSSIAHYTIMSEEFISGNPVLTLVPDISGCIIMKVKDNKFTCMYWGPTTKTVIVRGEPKEYDFNFFIEFYPIGAYTFFRIPQDKLRDQKIPLEAIDARTYESMLQAYEESSDINEFIQHIDAIFLKLKKEQDEQIFSLRNILDARTDILEPMDSFGYSRRHLQRLFQAQVGCSIKNYVRIKRINQAIMYLQNPVMPFIQVAQACGYYDQSHFIHDFKTVCSLTPTQYRARMSNFYNETHKF